MYPKNMEENSRLAVEVKNLTVSYNTFPILYNLNFYARKGTLTGIIGPNGSGRQH